MKTEQLFNFLEKTHVSQLIDYYNSAGCYETDSMNKLNPGPAVDKIVDLMEEKFNKKFTYTSGNFYKHKIPYLPHTDYKTYQNNTINIVLPLHYTDSEPNLIIFDQQWMLDSVSWCLTLPVKYFSVNIGVKGCPYEYPIENKTNRHIDKEFHQKYLSHFPHYCFRDLSGTAYPFRPGSIIIFDNRNIHCTGSFTGTKLGLSLRFKI